MAQDNLKRIRNIGCKSSQHDQCVFVHEENKIMLLLCANDVLLFGPDNDMLDETMQQIETNLL